MGAASVGWCAQIVRNLPEAREERAEPIEFLIHDRDYRFAPIFDGVFNAGGIETIRTTGTDDSAKGHLRLARARLGAFSRAATTDAKCIAGPCQRDMRSLRASIFRWHPSGVSGFGTRRVRMWCKPPSETVQWAGFGPSHRRYLDFLWSGRRDSNPRPSPWQYYGAHFIYLAFCKYTQHDRRF
jgi:hypothetical protein